MTDLLNGHPHHIFKELTEMTNLAFPKPKVTLKQDKVDIKRNTFHTACVLDIARS